MADITIDLNNSSIVNTETFSSTTTITVIISVDEFINDSELSLDNALSISISADEFINVSELSLDNEVSIFISLNSIENVSTVTVPWYMDYDSINILCNDIVNSNIVSDFDYLSTLQKLLNSVNNINFVSDVLVARDGSYIVDSVENVNIVSQPTLSLENIPITTTFNTRNTTNRKINNNYVFSDISLDFLAHPVTGDIAILYDYDAINQSLLNIIGTQRFERPFENYSVASRIKTLLFELSGNILLNELKSELFAAIINNEPRILLYDIVVYEKFEENSIGVQIFYKIKTFDRIEQLNTIISRT